VQKGGGQLSDVITGNGKQELIDGLQGQQGRGHAHDGR
jgi:hypothetical protein